MSVTKNQALMKLLAKLYSNSGLDLSQYKENMLIRRIDARVKRSGCKDYEEYIKLLEKDPDEYRELIGSVSINVTEFFRNPEMFNGISDEVIAEIVASKKKKAHKIIRVWSCGCSGGDEPYSMAILLLERLGREESKFMISVLGTDIDEDALAEAKQMSYSKERLGALGDDLLKRYFDQTEDGKFKLKGRVGALVKFRKHDVVSDYPIKHCDIIICRNLLIYFNKQLQEETILRFHACLNEGGYMILGMTESLPGVSSDYFRPIDNKLRIFQKKDIKREIDEGILSQGEIDRIVSEVMGK